MRTARDAASDLGGRAGTTVAQTIEQNPLLVAGVGLAIGALIASALPRTALETGLAGVATGELKRRAQAAAAGGFQAAREAVSDVVDKVTEQAQAQGLDPDALDRTARDLGQKVRRVAEAAVTTAFDPSQQEQRSNASGDNNHG
jgi:membrane-bound lytic murein transglycosylase B